LTGQHNWILCSQGLPAQHECIEDDLRWLQSVDVLATDGHRYYVACTEDDTWIDSYYANRLKGIIAWMQLPPVEQILKEVDT